MNQAVQPGQVGQSQDDVATLEALGSSLWSEGVVCKILQTQAKYGMVVKGPACYIHFFASFPTPLQILERNTGEVLRHSLVQNLGVSFWANSFQHKARIVCVDKAGANAKAERGLVADRSPAWSSGVLPCEVHITSTIFKKTYPVYMPEHVSGLLHTALSLRSGPSLGLFRRCLAKTIERQLVIMHGSPPREATQHKQTCMEIFMSDCSSSLVQRVLLANLPNGDWRRRGEVEYYPPAGAAANRAAVVQMFTSGLLFALVAHKPRLWPQHRWTGADIAIDELCRLEMVHGLLSSTYALFLDHCGTEETSARVDVGPEATSAAETTGVPPGEGQELGAMPAPNAAATAAAEPSAAGLDPGLAIPEEKRSLKSMLATGSWPTSGSTAPRLTTCSSCVSRCSPSCTCSMVSFSWYLRTLNWNSEASWPTSCSTMSRSLDVAVGSC